METETDRSRHLRRPFAGQAPLLAALALFGAAVVAMLLLRPAMPVVETRYLTVAWEMRVNSSYIVPSLNGEIYSDKPPLFFWLINLVWAVAGDNGLAARLVGPGFGLLCIVLTARLARVLWPADPARAQTAPLILVGSAAFLAYASTTMFDAMLAAAVLVAVQALWRLHRGGTAGAIVALGAALALGVFAKGPVVLLHVAPLVLGYPLWAGQGPRLSLARWYRRIGVALALAVGAVALWLVPALLLGGAEFRQDLLWRQSAGRIVNSFAHPQPFWFFLALVPALVWPWGWTRAGLAALAPARLRSDPAARLLGVWFLGALALFSIASGKQPHYLVPELPALALLISAADFASIRRARVWGRLTLAVPALVLMAFAVALWLGLTPVLPEIASTMSAANLAVAAGLLAVLLAALVWVRRALWVTALAAPATLLLAHLLAAPLLTQVYDPAPIAAILAQHEPAGLALTDHSYQGEFNFAGRLQIPITRLQGREALAEWAAQHPGGVIVAATDLSYLPVEPLARSGFRGGDYRLFRVR